MLYIPIWSGIVLLLEIGCVQDSHLISYQFTSKPTNQAPSSSAVEAATQNFE